MPRLAALEPEWLELIGARIRKARASGCWQWLLIVFLLRLAATLFS
jgi:hypothetical protein